MKALRLTSWLNGPSVRGRTCAIAGDRGGAGPRRGRRRVSLRPSSDVRVPAGTLPWSPPFTLGHENAGWVHQLGDGVRRRRWASPSRSWGRGAADAAADAAQGSRPTATVPTLAPVPGGGGGLGLDGGMAEFLLVRLQPGTLCRFRTAWARCMPRR